MLVLAGVHFESPRAPVKMIGAGYRPINDVYTIRGLKDWRQTNAVGFQPKKKNKKPGAAGVEGLPRWEGPGF